MPQALPRQDSESDIRVQEAQNTGRRKMGIEQAGTATGATECGVRRVNCLREFVPPPRKLMVRGFAGNSAYPPQSCEGPFGKTTPLRRIMPDAQVVAVGRRKFQWASEVCPMMGRTQKLYIGISPKIGDTLLRPNQGCRNGRKGWQLAHPLGALSPRT